MTQPTIRMATYDGTIASKPYLLPVVWAEAVYEGLNRPSLVFGSFEPPRLTRAQRVRRMLSFKIESARERVALRLAPWLDRSGDW